MESKKSSQKLWWVAFLLCASLLTGLISCSSEPDHGPGPIQWDRDTCERCNMGLSERRYGVQVREASDHKLHYFDDLGCALLWLDEQKQAGENGGLEELWVRNPEGTDWVDGRSARFRAGFKTPMGYGFHTVSPGNPEQLTLAEVWTRLRAKEKERRGQN